MNRRSTVTVIAHVHVNDLMMALREATINREDFDPRPWSIWDAESLEAAAALIRREIAAREAAATKTPHS